MSSRPARAAFVLQRGGWPVVPVNHRPHAAATNARQFADADVATILSMSSKRGNLGSLNGWNRNIRVGWPGPDLTNACQREIARGMPSLVG